MQDDEDVQILSSTAAPTSAASAPVQPRRITRSTSSSQHVPIAVDHGKAPRTKMAVPQRVRIPDNAARLEQARIGRMLAAWELGEAYVPDPSVLAQQQQRDQHAYDVWYASRTAEQKEYIRGFGVMSKWNEGGAFTLNQATRERDIQLYNVFIDRYTGELRVNRLRSAWFAGVTFAELPGPGMPSEQRTQDLKAFTAFLRTTDGENRWEQLESAWEAGATFNATLNEEVGIADEDAFWEWIRGDEQLPDRIERLRQLWEHDARYIRDTRVSDEQQVLDHDAHVAWFKGVYGRSPPDDEDENIEIPPTSSDDEDDRPLVSPAQKHAARASAHRPADHIADINPDGRASSAEFARFVGWLRNGIPPDPDTGTVRRADDAAYRAWLLTPEGSELAAAEDGIRTRPGSPAFDKPAQVIQSTQMMEMRLVDEIFAVKTRAAREVDRLRREADMTDERAMEGVIKHTAKQTEARLQAKLDQVRVDLARQQRIQTAQKSTDAQIKAEDLASLHANKGRGMGWLVQRKVDIDNLRYTKLFENLIQYQTLEEVKTAHGWFDQARVVSQLFLGVTVEHAPSSDYGTNSYVLRINLCGAGFANPIQGGWTRLTLDDNAVKGVYLNYFYSNRASGEDRAGNWAAMRRLGIEPRNFMVPVLRAFIRDHWLRRDDVAPNASFRLDAVGSAGGSGNDQAKLVEYYKTLGFEVTDHPSPRYAGNTHAMATTIETFLARTARTDTPNPNASSAKQALIWKADLSKYNALRIQIPVYPSLKRFHHPLVHPGAEHAHI